MKRAREDNIVGGGAHSKRPPGGSGESSEAGHPRLTTQDALQYLKAVKERFKDENDKYDEFLEVMREFKAQRIDTNGVIAKVKELFRGHNKLIMGFNAFLPKGYEIVLPEEAPPQRKQPVEFDQAITFVNKIKNRFQDNEQVYKAFLEILNNYRKGTKSIGDVYQEVATLFCDHADLLDEFTLFLPESSGLAGSGGVAVVRKEDKTSSRSSLERLPKKEKSQLEERGFGKAEKERRKADRERDRKEERENKDKDEFDDLDGQRLPQKRKSARRADELIRKQSQTGETGSMKEHAFFDKIKSRLRNRETYHNLLKILNLFTEQIISRADLQLLVSDILGRHPDLLEGFNDLFPRGDSEGCGAFARKTENEGVPSKMVKTERDHEREKDRDRERDVREREKDKERDRERERDRDKEKDRYNSKEGKVSLLPAKDKFLNKPISELDLSSCERCTPSYRLLPKSYSRPISSHRNDLANTVLNDNWVSVTSGSEDYSFKHMRRNQYEESLFRCEDDRFELDMLLESTIVTAKHVGALIEKLPECDNQIRLDDYLSAIHLRCIERIYGDHGLDIIDLLRKNAPGVLPVIYARLKQKEEEWSKCRADMNKVWAEVYAKNYHKSLDHRSFYFKQQDKKSLSTKALLAEVKEIHEKKRKEDDYILASVMGNRRLLMPNLKFEYPDQSIHEDLFQIMKYSADEVCNTMEQSDKIMRVWTTFLEPIFGVPPRPRGTEDAEEAAKVQAKEGRSSSGESAASGAAPKNGTGQAHDSATASSRLDASERKDKTPDVSGNRDQSGESQEGDVAPLDHLIKRDQNQGQEANQRETTSKTGGAEKESHRTHAKVDREEGELSPSPELDERHNTGEQAKKHRLTKDAAKEEQEEPEGDGDAEAEADADDEGEESGQKSSEDTDNASEPGEEVSGSDSGEPDDASREEHEEEEDGEKAESECEGEGMADADDGEGVGISSLTSSGRLSNVCEPLTPYVNVESSTSGSTIFYGNDMFYILFRLHQTLYERIHSAKTNSMAAEQKWKQVKDSSPPNLYEKFVRVLYNLLDGSADNNKFEDECRALIGTQSYVLFTLDKLIFKLLKQLQAIVADDAASKLLALHSYERSRRTAGYNDQVYHANVSVLLPDDSIYRFEHKPGSFELVIQLMEGAPEKIDVPPYAMDLAFSRYLDGLLVGPDFKDVDHHVFLVRNKKPSSELDELAMEEAMKDVQLVNGLEHKISTKTSKVSYVLDTEDLFHRLKPRSTATGGSHGRNTERRNRKFQDWVDGRLKSLPEMR